MRLAFLGTPDFAVPSLHALVDAGHDVAMVVSQPDRPRGRGQRQAPSPVRAAAIARGLPNRTLGRGERDALYGELLALDLDAAIVVAFGHLIREPLLNGPRLGCLNVHASLLPRWRGAAPIHRAVVAGDRETGVCVMQLEAGLDTGPVFDCARTAIGPDETTGELHDRLAALGAELLPRTLRAIESEGMRAKPQPDEGVTHAPKLERGEGSVDFDAPAPRVHDRIRGLSPWPAVTVMHGERRLKLLRSAPADASLAPGQLAVREDGLVVGCAEGALRLDLVQPPGKRAMSGADYARGHALAAEDRLRPLDGFRPLEAP